MDDPDVLSGYLLADLDPGRPIQQSFGFAHLQGKELLDSVLVRYYCDPEITCYN